MSEDALSYVMREFGLSFPDAVQHLSRIQKLLPKPGAVDSGIIARSELCLYTPEELRMHIQELYAGGVAAVLKQVTALLHLSDAESIGSTPAANDKPECYWCGEGRGELRSTLSTSGRVSTDWHCTVCKHIIRPWR